MTDNPNAERPERRSALIAKELARYNVDIAALSETRLADQGSLQEQGAGYTFFWQGRAPEDRRESGVGFAIRSNLAKKLVSLPQGINDRLMTLRLPISDAKHITIISAYAPTMTNPDENKEKFYEDLHTTLSAIPKADKVLLLGDFNARVGCDYETWGQVLGRNGVGKCNSNGELLLQLCCEHELLITNTLFRLPTRKKTSWMHPRSRHWHLIDYAIVRQRDRQDVRITRSMCGAECWTDHRLILTKLQLKIPPKRRPQGKIVPPRLNIRRLKTQEKSKELTQELERQADKICIDEDVESSWESFHKTVYETSLLTIGKKQRIHQDWFDENDPEISQLIAEKNRLHKAVLSNNSSSNRAVFRKARRKVQQRLRSMQDAWLREKAAEIQKHADTRDMKRFYDAVKEVYGPQRSSSSPIYKADGTTLLTDKGQILNRWAEHFETVLNRPSEINEEAINRLPQTEINEDLDNPPTLPEIEKAIHQLSNGKAPGTDGIPAEVYKHAGPLVLAKLEEFFLSIWRQSKVPQSFKDASVIHLYKRKGNRHCCDNHRGISLLCTAGKILARLLLNRLIDHLETGLLPESQCGFRKSRGTVDMIFAARQLQEKAQEHNTNLYTTFVDLTKAFDTVSRDGLWKIMAKFGCPDRFIKIVREFHDGMQAHVRENGEISQDFPVTNGVKQGCVLAPTLFSLMFSAMMNDAFRNEKPGLDVRVRTDGGLFNLRRLKAKTKTKISRVCELLFADDCALNTTSPTDMQHSMDLFATACNDFGLTISTKKTEVMFQPAPREQHHDPHITVNDTTLSSVRRFTYLGSTLSSCVHIDDEVNARIAKASAAFGRLRSSVWDRQGIQLSTKLMVYKAVVLTSLLYSSETWTFYRRHEKRLNRFHLNSLRKLLHVRWTDKVPDTEILRRSELQSIPTILRKTQLRWAGHVARMADHRLPKQLLFGELAAGSRSRGGQKKRFKDSLKSSMKDLQMNPSSWEAEAADRSKWRSKLHEKAKDYEARRISEAQRKRRERKERSQAGPAALPDDFTCHACNRTFRARIGLISHLKTH